MGQRSRRIAEEKYVGSEYDDGEGWASERVSWGPGRVFEVQTPGLYNAGPAARIQYKLIGGSNAAFTTGGLGINHHPIVSISPNNSAYTELSNETFRGYETRQYNLTLNNAQVGNTTYLKLFVEKDLNLRADNVCLSYAQITYPRQFDLNNQTQKWLQVTHQQGASRSFIQMQNVGYIGQANCYVLDVTGLKRIATQFSNGIARFVINNDGKPHNIWMYDSLQAVNITKVTKVSFPVISPAENHEFIIITHPVLEPAASNYTTYRSKKYKVLKVYSEQLYDYYYYGNKHPYAVQQFVRHLINMQPVAPKYLLLAGRGYQNDKARFLSNASPDPIKNYNKNLVPAIGVPGADALFSNGIKGDGFYAEIPTGRVSATNSDSLQNYLDKLITYEESPDSILPWRKHVLHVSGGTNVQGGQDQQGDFRNQLKGYANEIQGPELGAKVTSFSKSSSDPSQVDLRDQIVEVQNKGVGLMSFLGHASLTILDVDIGGINDLKNNNRYPFYYFSGCNVGNATEDDPQNGGVIYSKDYICAANKGAIGWLAHSNFTFTDQLPPLMSGFYSRYSKVNYGSSVGNIIYEITKGLSNGSLSTRTSNLQWVLQGDPSMVLYSPSAPDYTLSSSDVYLTAEVSTQSEFMDIGIIVSNNGKTSEDTIAISITRKLPNSQSVSYPVKYYNSIYNKDTFFVRMEMQGDLALGNNNLEIKVDANNDVPEIFENNNTINVNVFVPGNGLSAIFPEKDAVLGADTAWITIQNNNIQSTSNDFIIEVDVSDKFNSPQKVSSGIIKSSALLRWPFRITATDTTTYYWRARLNVSEQEGGRWSNSAFTYIPAHNNAWMQRTFPRFIDVSASNLLVVDTLNQKLDFSENTAIIDMYSSFYVHAGKGVWYGENLNPRVRDCILNGLIVILFDQRTLQPILNSRFPLNCPNVILNNQNPSNRKLYYYGFANDANGQAEFRRFIDSTEQGAYVTVFSIYDNANTTWSNATRQAFQKIGSSKVAALNRDSAAFVMVGQKGAPIGTIPEDTLYSIRQDTFAKLEKVVLYGKWYTASATSKLIGPAKSWKDVAYRYDPTENDGQDHNKISIIGVDKNSRDTLLFENAVDGQSLAAVDASIYPYLKLSVTLFDTTYRTPDQLRYWMVNYQPLPEGTISVDDGFTFHGAKLDQGDSLVISMAFRNISSQNFDSIPTLLRIIDANREVKYQWRENLGTLPGSQVVKLNKKIPTYDLSGQHGLEVYFNEGPQAELTKVNNYLYKNFEVKADKINPVLDVTFDGYRIVNGDFVSPKTVIRITSKDDSKFKLQNDTSSFLLYLKKPDATVFEQVNIDDARVLFKPAANSANKAELEFRPGFTEDGSYTLKVMSKDASGNTAGGNFYEIDFTVES
ncbi:MAG: C25 family cysteine peptidase, partial [Bacteroidota bacterium]